MLRRLDGLFQLHVRTGDSALDFFTLYPASPDRVNVGSLFLRDDVIRHPDLEVHGPRLFKMDKLLAGNVDRFRQFDDELPLVEHLGEVGHRLAEGEVDVGDLGWLVPGPSMTCS